MNKQYYQEHREEILAKRRQYYQEHREEKLKKCKEYWEAHKDEEKKKENNRKKAKRWRDKNPEKVKEAYRRWKEKHPEKVSENNKRWREKHPNYSKEYNAKYNSKYMNSKEGKATHLKCDYNREDKKHNRGECTITTQWIIDNIFTKQCVYCGESDWTKLGCDRIDNTKPHTPDNVVCSCTSCNKKRGRKDFTDFYLFHH